MTTTKELIKWLDGADNVNSGSPDICMDMRREIRSRLEAADKMREVMTCVVGRCWPELELAVSRAIAAFDAAGESKP